MALFGKIDYLEDLLKYDSRFTSAFNYLKKCLSQDSKDQKRILNLASGEVEKIDLENHAFALDQVYFTRKRGDCFFESHQTYIDVQCLIEGEEIMDVISIGDLEIEKPYHKAKDVAIYKDAGLGSRLKIKSGEAAIFFPEDGHMPGQFETVSQLIRKTVIKVPV